MSSNDKKYSVLFVDDEKRILTALRSIFRREYDVHIANGGEEALQILAQQKIDVIVSDQRMPNMLGNELLSKVHQLYPNTMRLLLTGFMDKEAIIRTINEGEIYRFINKPWRNEDIQQIIAEAALASEFEIDEQDTPQKTHKPIATSLTKLQTEAGIKPKESVIITDDLSDQAILMMGSNQTLRNQIRHLCRQHDISIYGTQSVAQAIGAVAARPAIGVTIIELPVNTEETLQAISLLKKQRPELISIVLTDETDAETAVDLINTGQVFRYMAKPLQNEQLQHVIQQAFRRHRVLKNNTEAHKRFKVATPTSKIAAGLKELFSSFGLTRKHT